jgi:secondary thiamine-phosphate synthase enzyme
MATFMHKFQLKTEPDDIINITSQVETAVKTSAIKDGIVCTFMPGSTGGISFLEYEPGLVDKDIPELLQKLIPEGPEYVHHQTWGDHNGHSHLRSFLIPPSLSIPIQSGKLLRGTWQQIVFCDFDEKPRTRTLYCQIVGEK